MKKNLLKLLLLGIITGSLMGCSAWDTLRGHDDDDDVDEKKIEKQIEVSMSEKDKENINNMTEKMELPKEIVVKPVYN